MAGASRLRELGAADIVFRCRMYSILLYVVCAIGGLAIIKSAKIAEHVASSEVIEATWSRPEPAERGKARFWNVRLQYERDTPRGRQACSIVYPVSRLPERPTIRIVPQPGGCWDPYEPDDLTDLREAITSAELLLVTAASLFVCSIIVERYRLSRA